MPQTKNIEGLTITCASLEPADAYDLLPELAPILGAVLGGREAINAVAKYAKAAAEGRETDAAAVELDIEPILRSVGERLGGGKLTEILVRLMRATVVHDGQTVHRILDRATLNLAFAGRMWSVFAVAAFAFEVTYGNFSDVVARLPGVVRVSAAGTP